MPYAYQRDPATIYRQSFAAIGAELDLTGIDPDLASVIVRIVHASGLPEAATAIRGDGAAVRAGRSALDDGAPILCDCRMVAAGIISARLPRKNAVVALIEAEDVPARAREIGNTRSAAAIDLARDRLAGAVVVIGNAPTALFRLLEIIDEGGPRPALILGFPVGFVGAAESKAALVAHTPPLPHVTITGRWGGSAMASAALNAVVAGLPEADLPAEDRHGT